MVRKSSPSTITMWLACLAATTLLLLGPGPAQADNVALLVNDHADDPLSAVILGTVTNPSITVTQEGIGQLGIIDVSFDYVSTDPLAQAAFGPTTTNFNIYEDAAQTMLSDTWSITLTGSGGGNVNVHAVFQSDTLDEVPPPAIPGATPVIEIPSLPPPDNMVDATYQYVGPLLTDLTTGFNSSVPEPSTWVLLGIGVVGMGCYRGRRWAGARRLRD